MKKQKKGFSLIETLVALFIFASLLSIFGLLMTKGIRMSKSGEKTHDVLNDGLIISERIYKNMRYTSATLVNVFPYIDKTNNNISPNKNECLAIGFPIISALNSSNTIDVEQTGYNIDNYECIDISDAGANNFKKNWQGYMLYLYDKDGEYFGNKNYFYEIKFKYPNIDLNNRTVLTRKTNSDWAKTLPKLKHNYDYSSYSLDTRDFYKDVLDYILLENDQTIIIKNKNLLSKNIKSFKISTNSYPTFKMRVLLDYGTHGGNNDEGRRNIGVEKKAENFEMNWVVHPIN